MVRTSSFHVEDTGSIPVRDRYWIPAGMIAEFVYLSFEGGPSASSLAARRDEISTSLSNGRNFSTKIHIY